MESTKMLLQLDLGIYLLPTTLTSSAKIKHRLARSASKRLQTERTSETRELNLDILHSWNLMIWILSFSSRLQSYGYWETAPSIAGLTQFYQKLGVYSPVESDSQRGSHGNRPRMNYLHLGIGQIFTLWQLPGHSFTSRIQRSPCSWTFEHPLTLFIRLHCATACIWRPSTSCTVMPQVEQGLMATFRPLSLSPVDYVTIALYPCFSILP